MTDARSALNAKPRAPSPTDISKSFACRSISCGSGLKILITGEHNRLEVDLASRKQNWRFPATKYGC